LASFVKFCLALATQNTRHQSGLKHRTMLQNKMHKQQSDASKKAMQQRGE
jgi:hypothetical protein